MMKKLTIILALTGLFTLFLSGCENSSSQTSVGVNDNTTQQTNSISNSTETSNSQSNANTSNNTISGTTQVYVSPSLYKIPYSSKYHLYSKSEIDNVFSQSKYHPDFYLIDDSSKTNVNIVTSMDALLYKDIQSMEDFENMMNATSQIKIKVSSMGWTTDNGVDVLEVVYSIPSYNTQNKVCIYINGMTSYSVTYTEYPNTPDSVKRDMLSMLHSLIIIDEEEYINTQ